MATTFKIIAGVIIFCGLFTGVRFIGSTIHYNCHQERITNTADGDDCAPPIEGVGELSFYLTGGSFNPYLNRDAITVRRVQWVIEKKNPSIANADDPRFYEQSIAADVMTYDGIVKRYMLGSAYGCTGTSTSELQDHTIVIGRVACDFADSGTSFSAYKGNGGFHIDRYDESAKDGSVRTTSLVTIE